MKVKKILSLVFCLGLVTAAAANPTYTGYNNERFEFRRYIEPGKSVDFKLLVTPARSYLKIDNQTYRYGKLDFLELVSTEDSCASATALWLNGERVDDITVRNGEAFRSSYSNMPRAFFLRGKLTSDMALPLNYSSGGAFFHDGKPPFGGGKNGSNVPVVPVPGAILLGSCGLLVLNKFRKIV